jgi:hypothetical protein
MGPYEKKPQIKSERWARGDEGIYCGSSVCRLFSAVCLWWEVEFYDSWMFYIDPELTRFIRETTAAEQDAGITYSHALVLKEKDGISRLYAHLSLPDQKGL